MTGIIVNTNEGPSATSVTLLERVRALDQAAWRRLVYLYTPLVYRWCRRAGLQAADAADVGQEVFWAVARKIACFSKQRPGSTFRGWLRVITRNKLRDFARRTGIEPSGRGGSANQECLLKIRAPEQGDAGRSPDPEEARTLYRRALELLQVEFEPQTWRAFWGVVVEGSGPDEVAAELNVTVNAVYLAKSRILRRLREEFADLVHEDLL